MKLFALIDFCVCADHIQASINKKLQVEWTCAFVHVCYNVCTFICLLVFERVWDSKECQYSAKDNKKFLLDRGASHESGVIPAPASADRQNKQTQSGAVFQLNFSLRASNYWGVEVVTFPLLLETHSFELSHRNACILLNVLQTKSTLWAYQFVFVEYWHLHILQVCLIMMDITSSSIFKWPLFLTLYFDLRVVQITKISGLTSASRQLFSFTMRKYGCNWVPETYCKQVNIYHFQDIFQSALTHQLLLNRVMTFEKPYCDTLLIISIESLRIEIVILHYITDFSKNFSPNQELGMCSTTSYRVLLMKPYLLTSYYTKLLSKDWKQYHCYHLWNYF